LAAHNVPFRQTHNLEELLAACVAIDTAFGQFALAARMLTLYAVRFRYPGGPLAPSLTEAEESLELAHDLLRFVRGTLAL
jgi:hypothetical protein